MVYGYARCSTNDTKQDIERQKRELREMGAEEVYFEYESGTVINRPELAKMMRHVSDGDTIVATEVSRITRSMKQLCEILDTAKEKHLKIVLGTFVVDCTETMNAMTEAMLKMMGVFSELERNMAIERINSGIRNARAKGVRLGRPRFRAEDIPAKAAELLPAWRDGHISKADYAKICGISRPTLNKYIAVMTDA